MNNNQTVGEGLVPSLLPSSSDYKKPSPLGKVDFSSPPRAMKKTEEVLPQYGFAAG